jgi:hypothetical protein
MVFPDIEGIVIVFENLCHSVVIVTAPPDANTADEPPEPNRWTNCGVVE